MLSQPLPPGPRAGIAPPGPPARTHLSLTAFALHAAVAVLVAVVILVIVYLLWLGVRILLEAFAGVLFAVFLTTLSGWVSRVTKLRHGWALAIVITTLFLLTGGLGWLLANRLAAEAVQLTRTLPASLEQVRRLLGGTAWGHFLLEQFPDVTAWLARPGTFEQVTGLVSGVAGFLVAVLVIFFVGLFGAAEPEVYRAGLLHLVPPSRRRRAGQALDAVTDNLRWWLAGQVFLMVAVGVVTGLGLWLLGIPLALSLGLVAGLFEMIPYLGPWLSAIPAVLVALMVGPWHVLMVLGLYLGIHILEGYVLGPLVQRRAVRLPPALTLVAQVLLGSQLGLLGLFVAAPLTAAVVVGLKMLYVQDTLGDQNVSVSPATHHDESHPNSAAAGKSGPPGVNASGTT
jgi:predicted PurR-regulated permease PerM